MAGNVGGVCSLLLSLVLDEASGVDLKVRDKSREMEFEEESATASWIEMLKGSGVVEL